MLSSVIRRMSAIDNGSDIMSELTVAVIQFVLRNGDDVLVNAGDIEHISHNFFQVTSSQ